MTAELILTFIKANWKILLVSGVLIGALTYVESLRVEVAHQVTTIVTLTDDNKTLSDNNTKLEDAIKTSNQALDVSDKAAKAAAADFIVIQHNILQQTTSLKAQLAGIVQQKDPATCNDAILFLISNMKGYNK
jgi:cell division protein FtsB